MVDPSGASARHGQVTAPTRPIARGRRGRKLRIDLFLRPGLRIFGCQICLHLPTSLRRCLQTSNTASLLHWSFVHKKLLSLPRSALLLRSKLLLPRRRAQARRDASSGSVDRIRVLRIDRSTVGSADRRSTSRIDPRRRFQVGGWVGSARVSSDRGGAVKLRVCGRPLAVLKVLLCVLGELLGPSQG